MKCSQIRFLFAHLFAHWIWARQSCNNRFLVQNKFTYEIIFCITNEISFTIISLSSSNLFYFSFLDIWHSWKLFNVLVDQKWVLIRIYNMSSFPSMVSGEVESVWKFSEDSRSVLSGSWMDRLLRINIYRFTIFILKKLFLI